MFLSCPRKVWPNFHTQQATHLRFPLAESCSSSFDGSEDGGDYLLVHFTVDSQVQNYQDSLPVPIRADIPSPVVPILKQTCFLPSTHVPSGVLVGDTSKKSHCLYGRDFLYPLELRSSSWWWQCIELVSGSWVRRLWNDSLSGKFWCTGQRQRVMLSQQHLLLSRWSVVFCASWSCF